MRLGLDHVDLLLIHWPNPAIAISESMAALGDARRKGLTRHIGVSNFTIATLAEAMRVSAEPIVTNQIEYHPYLDQRRLLAAIRGHGLAITAYCPDRPRQGRRRCRSSAAIARAHGKTDAQVTLRWLIQQGDVIAIPRTSKSDRLRENLDVFDFELTPRRWARMGGLARPGSKLINEPGLGTGVGLAETQ